MLTEEFKTAFAQYVKEFEGEKLKIYDDGFGVPTIGNGFALINKIQNRWEAFPEDQLKAKGLNLTEKQLGIIQTYAKLKTQGKSTAKLKSQLKQLKDAISPELSRSLLMSSIQDKYNQIKNQIGEENWDKLNFVQQLGIMDHCFQKGNVIKLKQSLNSGDYQKTAEIIRDDIKPAFKARADLRADFVEYGIMEFPGIHIVKSGETLAKIAKTNSLSLNELKRMNPELCKSDKLSVGQKIKLVISEIIPSVILDEEGNRLFRFEILHKNEQKGYTMDDTKEIYSGAFFVRLKTKNFITNIAPSSKDFDAKVDDQNIKSFLFNDVESVENSGGSKILNLTKNQYSKVLEYLASGIKYGHVEELQQAPAKAEEKIAEDYFLIQGDDNISVIQDLYHAAGLPLYFTVAYSKEELNNLQSEDAKKALAKYSCKDDIKQKLHLIQADSKEEVSDALNIDPTLVETASNFWSCFSPGNTEFRVKIDKTLLDSITSIANVTEEHIIHGESVADNKNMSKILNKLFLSFKLPPEIGGNEKENNNEFDKNDHLKFNELHGFIEEEMSKNKDKLEKLLLTFGNQNKPSGGNFTKDELISIYEKKIEELQEKFKQNWKKFQNNPTEYKYQPGDKLPGSATFNEEQIKLSNWLSEELSKISDGPTSTSGNNENTQMKENIIKDWNREMDLLRNRPEFNDKLNESINDIHTTISLLSKEMTNFFQQTR